MDILQEWHKHHKEAYPFRVKDLAEYLGITPEAIRLWLRGKSKPKDECLALIQKYLNEVIYPTIKENREYLQRLY